MALKPFANHKQNFSGFVNFSQKIFINVKYYFSVFDSFTETQIGLNLWDKVNVNKISSLGTIDELKMDDKKFY